jgi:hypothetical protein
MEQTRVWIVVIGLLLVASMAGFGYWLGVRVEQGATPEVSASPSPVATVTPPPTPTVQAAATASPPTPTPFDQGSLGKPTPLPTKAALTIFLEEVPLSVRPGTSLRVRWQVQGSPGSHGTSTRLLVSLSGTPESVGPASGPYALPARFEALVTLQKPGSFLLVAEAVVEGQTLRAERPVTVE